MHALNSIEGQSTQVNCYHPINRYAQICFQFRYCQKTSSVGKLA